MKTTPRIAIGGILHETHTFMPQPTTLDDFASLALHQGADLLQAMRGARSGIGGMIDAAEARGWQLLPTIYAAAMPAGPVTDAAYRSCLRTCWRQLARLRVSMACCWRYMARW